MGQPKGQPNKPLPRQLFGAVVAAAALFCLDVLRAGPRDHLLAAVWLSFASALAKFLLWGVVAVVVWRLIWRVPIDGQPRVRAVGVHLLASLGLSAAVTLLADAVQSQLRQPLLATLPAGASLAASWLGASQSERAVTLAMAFPWDLLTYWAIFAGLAFWSWALRARERERQALELSGEVRRAHLHALETQLHPHFLFNTLHTISALLARDRPAARDITRRLRDLFAKLLAGRDRPVGPLADELSLLEDYVAIQKARFGDRLAFELDVDPGCSAVIIPTLLLQPLVENAVRHGAAQRAGATRIAVRARRVNELVELSVHDDGPGCRAVRPGIGLNNTRQRLESLYGDRQRLDFQGRALPWGGTRVTVTIPFQPEASPLPVLPSPHLVWPSGWLGGWLGGWLLFLAAMFVLNLVWASARYVAHDPGVTLTWMDELLAGARGGGALVLLFPLVYLANRRLVRRVRGLAGRLALHALLAVALSLAKSSLVRALALLFGGAYADVPIRLLVANRIYADLLHYAVMAGLCHALEHYRRHRVQALEAARLEADLAGARLQALQRQVQPAWLFERLERLETLIERAPAEADQLVTELGDRLRELLRSGTSGASRAGVP